MKVITCITDEGNMVYNFALKASCEYHGLELVTLKHKGLWDSHRNKDIHLINYLEKVNADEIVIFTDAYDTFFLGNEEAVLKRYFGAFPQQGLVISAEIYCHPDASLSNAFPVVSSPYRFPNSGGIIGRCKDFLAALNKLMEFQSDSSADKYKNSNQYLWSKVYLECPELKLTIDHNCEIFQTFPTSLDIVYRYLNSSIGDKKMIINDALTQTLKNFEVTGNLALFNKTTKSLPIHLHLNGPVLKPGILMSPFRDFLNIMT